MTVLKSVALLCTGLLYARNPTIGPFQLLIMPCLFGIAIQMIELNIGLKKAVWDGINKTNVAPLIMRTCQGVISNLISTAVTKAIPLTIIGVVNNLAPVIVVIAAFFILKERLKVFEIVTIVLTICCVIVIVVGGDAGSGDDTDETVSHSMFIVLYVLLFVNPFLSAGGVILMRKMKKFNVAVVTWYLNWAICIVSIIIVAALRSGFQYLKEYDWQSWVIAICCGAAYVATSKCGFVALKYQQAAKLQKLAPLSTLWQFFFDVFVFGKVYTTTQYCGLGVLFLIYILQGVKFVVYDLP